MRWEIALLLLPLTHNVINYTENCFVNIYIPYIDYEDVIEVPYTYLVNARTSVDIRIRALSKNRESIIYDKTLSSGSKTFISDYFPISGDWFKDDVTFIFTANTSYNTSTKILKMPYLERTTYDFAGELSIANSNAKGISDSGRDITMEESIYAKYDSSSKMKFDLDDFSFTYQNSFTKDFFYSKANLKITDKSNVFSFIAKDEDAFNIPLELAKIDEQIVMSFQESIYLEQTSLSTYLYYKEGLINQNKKIYFPLDHKIKDAYIEIELTIGTFGYSNTNLVFYSEIYLSGNTMGLCASSEVCVKHV